MKQPHRRALIVMTAATGLEYPDHWEAWEALAWNFDKVHLQAAREHAKTYFWSLFFLLKLGMERRSLNIISYSEEQAIKILSQMADWIESSPMLQPMKPKSEAVEWSKTKRVFSNGSVAYATSFGTAIRGHHDDDVWLDDPIKDFGGMTPDDQWTFFTSAIMPTVNKGGQIVVSGTPVYDGDILDRLSKVKDFQFRRDPAIVDGKPLWPNRWPIERLEVLRRMDSIAFSHNYMLERVDPATAPFKKEWLKYWSDSLPTRLEKILTVDPAITLNGDANGLIVTGTDEKRFTYVLDVVELRAENISLVVDKIFQLVTLHGIRLVVLEAIGFQRLLAHWLHEEMRKRNVFFGITEVRHQQKSKQARILALQPMIQSGTLIFGPGQENLTNQLLMFPRSKYDDLCFPAGTLIATPTGDRPIENLRVGNEVLTPLGIKKVLASGFTGMKRVVPIPGTNLLATPNHPVFVSGEGFHASDTLTMGTRYDKLTLCNLQRWAYRKALYSKGSHTGSWGRENITSVSHVTIRSGKVLRDFMWRFGKIIMGGQFRKAFTFTIETATRSITVLRTWTAYRLWNTIACLKEGTLNRFGTISLGIKTRCEPGIVRRKDCDGTAKMPSGIGCTPVNTTWHVLSAGRNSNRLCGTQNIVTRTAARDIEKSKSDVIAAARHSVQAGLIPPSSVRGPVGLSVTKETEVGVYNLTVDDDHCYYANGVLVSNCDSLAMGLGHWNTPDEAAVEEKVGTFDWYASQLEQQDTGWKAGLFSDMGHA